MKYELTVDADWPVRTVVINRAAESSCVNGPAAGFAAEVATMQTAEHRDRLTAFKQTAERK